MTEVKYKGLLKVVGRLRDDDYHSNYHIWGGTLYTIQTRKIWMPQDLISVDRGGDWGEFSVTDEGIGYSRISIGLGLPQKYGFKLQDIKFPHSWGVGTNSILMGYEGMDLTILVEEDLEKVKIEVRKLAEEKRKKRLQFIKEELEKVREQYESRGETVKLVDLEKESEPPQGRDFQ
jgi:hypothetical protein